MQNDWQEVLTRLEKGELRVAEKIGNSWQVNTEIKKAILTAFKEGKNEAYLDQYEGFVDKHNLSPRKFKLSDQVRMVPGGSAVRTGAYVAPGVIIMPPAYINVGAYIDTGTMVDSHVLVGSCAQIGKNVHLSAGVQIGGVIEPVGAKPVIIEDEVFVGAGAIIVEGVVVKSRAVIAPGVIISKATPIYDCVNKTIIRDGVIPENVVIIPGTRPINNDWAKAQGLNISCPIIIKYRDAKSDVSLELETVIR